MEIAVLIVGCIAVFAVLVYIALLYLTAPSSDIKLMKERLDAMTSVCFAHKGLYKKDQTVPENTIPAFKAALAHGYGIDCDVQLTWDGQAVCFCDQHMRMACGIDELMVSFNYEHLEKLKLFGTEERMPLLSEALELIAGKTPMIIEVKSSSQRSIGKTCSAIYDLLKDYKGAFCIASYDPHILKWFRLNAPDVLRMQASKPYFDWRENDRNVIRCLIMSRFLCNVLSRPHLLAYAIGPVNAGFKLALKNGAPLVLFTANKRHQHAELLGRCSTLIFEDYLPPALTSSKEEARNME